jgi:hypothetical protein
MVLGKDLFFYWFCYWFYFNFRCRFYWGCNYWFLNFHGRILLSSLMKNLI